MKLKLPKINFKFAFRRVDPSARSRVSGGINPLRNPLRKISPMGLIRLIGLISLIAGIFFVFQTQFSKPTIAAWMDDSWGYRKAISIPSHTSAENNVYVTVPTFDATDTSRFQADCGDLRFTKQNGELLPYYVVDCDATANIHVQFDTLPAGASTYLMYYGNPSAANGFSSADFATAATGLGTQTLASEEKSQGPVAYWKFDDASGTSAQDATANNNDGTITGATWQTEDQCVSGKCLYFDGASSNTYVAANDSNNLRVQNMTISVWVKQTGKTVHVTSGAGIIAKGNGSNNGSWDVVIRNSDNHVLFRNTDLSTTNIDTGITLNQNKWDLLSATWDGSNAKIYQNGVLKKTQALTGTIVYTSAALTIGARQISPTISNFPGFIDDVKIYNYARTAAQVKTDFAGRGASKGSSAIVNSQLSTVNSLSNGLVGYWKMDESAANSCTGGVNDSCDSSGNGSDLAHQTTFTSSAGKFSNSQDFEASTSDYLSINDNASLSIAGSLTIAAWINTESLANGQIVAKDVTGARSYYLRQFSTSIGFVVSSDGTNATAYRDSTTTIVNGTWVHVVGVYDSVQRTMNIYRNGQLDDGTLTGTVPSSIYDSTTSFRIGNDGNDSGGYFDGKLDDVRIYNRALSPREVRDLYNFAPGPVGYWNMDEKTGQTVNDLSGNGNAGTLGINSGVASDDPTWKSGKFGSALYFDGGDEVDMSENDNLDLNNVITVSAWVKRDNAGDHDTIFSKRNDFAAGAAGYGVILDSTGPARVEISDGTTEYNFYSAVSINTNWHYITAVIDKSITANNKIYVDGVLSGGTTSGSVTGSTYTNAILPKIGFVQDSTFRMDGYIDDLKIYNYARTSKQIVEDMNAGHPSVGSPVGSAVAYWKFDEGYGTTAYNSGSGGSTLNGTFDTNAPDWTNSGKFGKALSFTSANSDHIDIGNLLASDFNGLTVSAWIKPTTLTGWFIGEGGAFRVGLSASGDIYCWHRGWNSSGVDTTDQTTTSNSPIASGNWYDVTCAWDGTTGIRKIYVNGIEKASGISSIVTTKDSIDSNNATIGDGYNNQGSYFNGLIDEVKMYNYALTSDEVKTEYNHGSAMVLGALGSNSSYASDAANQQYCVPGDSTSCAAPVGEWNFEEKSGQTANDTSENGNNSVISNPAWTSGKVGSALKTRQDSNTQQVATITDPASGALDFDNTQDYTLEAWVKSSGNESWVVPIWKGGASASDDGYDIEVSPTDNLTRCRYTDGNGSGAENPASTTNIKDGNWHLITCVMDRDGSEVGTAGYHTFIDGRLEGSDTSLTEGSAASNADNLLLGEYTTSYEFDGGVDQVRIFNYARTPAQIAWDYNRGNPVGWWKMDECQGGTANDSSGNGNSGTITIGATGTQTNLGNCGVGNTAAAWSNGATGKYNSSLNFDGTDDYVAANGVTAKIAGSNTTVSAWIKTTDTSSWFLSFNTSTYGNRIMYGISSNKFTFYDDGGGATVGTQTINDDNWHHVVGVHDDQNNTVTTYVDGKIDKSSISSTYSIASTDLFSIGQEWDAGPTASDFLNGQIDDVQIFNYALTANQIKTLYNQSSGIRFGPSAGTP